MASVAAAYVALRWHLTGGAALSTPLREVDNFIPFLRSRSARLATTAAFHARYAALLLAPLQLSADWSVGCIPPVTHLTDVRLAAPALLYASLVFALWRLGGPVGPLADADAAPGRVCAFVLVGLLLVPALPAANVISYIGTVLGERLLYAPSVGFCLLAALALAAASLTRPRAVAAAAAALLVASAARTGARNLDWANDGTLFRSAAAVCPGSARVALWTAILAGREGRPGDALAAVAAARAASPGWCDPDYFESLALSALGDQEGWLRATQLALHCPGYAQLMVPELHAIAAQRLAADANDANAHMLRSLLLAHAGSQDEAAAAALRGVALLEAAGLRKQAARSRASYVPPGAEARAGVIASLACTRDADALPAALAAADAVDAAAASPHAGWLGGEGGGDREALVRAAWRAVSTARSAAARAYVAAQEGRCGSGEAYFMALHAAHTAVPHDPFLQRAWASALLLRSRDHAGARDHLIVAEALFRAAAEAAGEAAAAGAGAGAPSQRELADNAREVAAALDAVVGLQGAHPRGERGEL
jgi:hypothetical protein